MPYTLGAYAAAPKSSSYDPALERMYFAELRNLPGVRGLELPFYGQLHAHDVPALLGNLKPAWRYVLTGLPGTMDALAQDAHFGLASDVAAGRSAAVAFCGRLRDAVALLNTHFGQPVVHCVELHSAPRQGVPGVTASGGALAESLREVRGWDWHGAALAVEHCDAYVPGQPPQKGFLGIEAELDALAATQDSRTPAGMVINWGRSAIEGRSAETPRAHLRAAKARRLLSGFMLSGACAEDPVYGNWQDTHAPFAPAFGLKHGAEHSLLTVERAQACLREAGSALEVLGLKIQPLPPGVPLETRVAFLKDALRWLDQAAAAASQG
jgi:hypothetical protein